MSASKMGFKQDLPPAGGFAPIQTQRTKLRTVIGWKTGIAAFVVTNVIGWVGYTLNWRAERRHVVEMRSARFAMLPLLIAEKDRAFLKQLRKNRDEEEELMKDYPGWVTGTYFGEPVFHNVGENDFVHPQFHEFTIHADPNGTRWIRDNHHLLT